MILVRNVFRTKWGHAQDFAQAMKRDVESMAAQMPGGRGRILTDLSGPFFTVVLESEHESLGAWEQWRAQLFTRPEFTSGFAQMNDVIESGSAEFYTIEAEIGGTSS